MPEGTTFHEAAARLKQLLVQQGLSSTPLWLFREDVVGYRHGKLFIHTPVPATNERLAETLYGLGYQRRLGIELHAFGLLGARPCCYIVLPSDETDAEYRMMSGENVKYSVSTSMMPVIESDNFLRAFFNKRLLQRDSFDILTDMPSKVF